MKYAVDFLCATFGVVFVVAITPLVGCSAPDDFGRAACDPNAFEPDPWCVQQNLVAEDAGADGQADASADADVDVIAAIDNPGLDTSTWVPPDACKTGTCVPAPVGDQAGLWEKEPIALWIGPANQVPVKCPDAPSVGVPNEKFRLFDQLVAAPATCLPCGCGVSKGGCSGVPETLELRAGKCAENGAMTIPFHAPANWDGSCTNADSIAAGATCPAGSQTLCTQSVHSVALPAPSDDACEASASAPAAALESSWQIGALACEGNTEEDACGTDTVKAYCVNHPGNPWLQCTYREGVHEKCPDNYKESRHVLFPKEPVDDRGCSACQCGAPMGSACIGGLTLGMDSTCATELVTLQVGSIGPMCYDFLVPGKAIASKAIVNREYVPGVCAVSGGQPVGSAAADVKGAVTFCCRTSEPLAPEPPH